MSFVEIAQVNQVPVGTMKSFPVSGKQILIVNLEGNFYSIANECTHMGGDLSKGKLEGQNITCPRHGAKFDVTSGDCITFPKIAFFRPKIKNENAYEVKVEGNSIKVNI